MCIGSFASQNPILGLQARVADTVGLPSIRDELGGGKKKKPRTLVGKAVRKKESLLS